MKGFRSAMSIPADLLLSGALAHPASTIVHLNCFEHPISSPTGALRCVATKTTIEKFRVARSITSSLSWFADGGFLCNTLKIIQWSRQAGVPVEAPQLQQHIDEVPMV